MEMKRGRNSHTPNSIGVEEPTPSDRPGNRRPGSDGKWNTATGTNKHQDKSTYRDVRAEIENGTTGQVVPLVRGLKFGG